MNRLESLLSLILLLSVAVPAVADTTLYSNGAINGTIDAWNISSGKSDSFTLSAPADVETMSLGIWANPSSGTPATLQFGISASPFGTDLGSGTETLSNVFQFINRQGADVYESSFTFPSIDLAAGTYWITLFNGMTTNQGPLFWDQNNGPSEAFQSPGNSIPSESFSLGGTTAVPEPGTLILLGTGLLGIAGTIRRKLAVNR